MSAVQGIPVKVGILCCGGWGGGRVPVLRGGGGGGGFVSCVLLDQQTGIL